MIKNIKKNIRFDKNLTKSVFNVIRKKKLLAQKFMRVIVNCGLQITGLVGLSTFCHVIR